MFPDASRQERNPQAPKFIIEPGAAPRVAAIVELTKAIPEHLVTLEPEPYIFFVTSLKVLESWASNGGWGQNLVRIQGLTDDNPLTTLLKALRSCPDEYPSPGTSALAFIDDEDLRTSLRLDLEATEQAINNGEWKSATVLAGSIVEALLLWKLRTEAPDKIETTLNAMMGNSQRLKPSTQLESWDLWQYIAVASHLGLISDQGKAQANLTKDFRNFIHPGKSMRTREKCTRPTALIALATAIRIIDEFAGVSN
jgi:hypothetical protein